MGAEDAMLSLNNNNGTVYIILVKQLDSNQFFSLKKRADGRMVGWSDGCSARVKTHIKTYHLFSNNRDDDVNHLL